MKMEFGYKYDDLFNPLLNALHNLGGSGSVEEIEEETSKILKLSDTEINDIHKGNSTKFSYRLAWARNYLKRFGLIENSSRGVWSLTNKGNIISEVDKDIVKREVISQDKIQRKEKTQSSSQPIEPQEFIEELLEITWQEELIEEIQKMHPSSFERLCQRLLRELGFQNVEVTGRTNDGGIDGKGLLRLSGVLSFHVVFQAKRYKGSISSSVIRDFRGAMIGRAEKGIVITTGRFSAEAKKEAIRNGAPPIDLIDGNELAEKLKELRIGIEVELVEKVKIKNDWFKVF